MKKILLILLFPIISFGQNSCSWFVNEKDPFTDLLKLKTKDTRIKKFPGHTFFNPRDMTLFFSFFEFNSIDDKYVLHLMAMFDRTPRFSEGDIIYIKFADNDIIELVCSFEYIDMNPSQVDFKYLSRGDFDITKEQLLKFSQNSILVIRHHSSTIGINDYDNLSNRDKIKSFANCILKESSK